MVKQILNNASPLNHINECGSAKTKPIHHTVIDCHTDTWFTLVRCLTFEPSQCDKCDWWK